MFDQHELVLNILIFIKLVLFIILIFLVCAYALPICIFPRFHTPTNLMTVHLCLTFIGSAIFWMIVYLLDFNDASGTDIITQERCSVLYSIETMLNCLVIYSLCAVGINRYFNIIYANKIIFKTRRWAFICIGLTWLITLTLSSLTLISLNTQVRI